MARWFPPPPAASRDRRHGFRAYLTMPVRLLAGPDPGGLDVAMRDLSPGGCYLQTDGPPPVVLGARVAIGFAQADGDAGLAKGRVVRVDDRGFAMAIEEVNGAFAELMYSAAGAPADAYA